MGQVHCIPGSQGKNTLLPHCSLKYESSGEEKTDKEQNKVSRETLKNRIDCCQIVINYVLLTMAIEEVDIFGNQNHDLY